MNTTPLKPHNTALRAVLNQCNSALCRLRRCTPEFIGQANILLSIWRFYNCLIMQKWTTPSAGKFHRELENGIGTRAG